MFLGGILPVVTFTLIEDQFGTLWGLIVGMIFGIGEISWEYFSQRKVDPITWGGNGLLLVLGTVSLLTQEGLWFKLQPAIIELGFTMFLWGSLFFKKPLLWIIAQKQGALPSDLETQIKPAIGSFLKRAFQGLTFRLGVFFFGHALLATWAALYWSSSAWAILKGVGFTLSMIVYLVVEMLILRYRISSIARV